MATPFQDTELLAKEVAFVPQGGPKPEHRSSVADLRDSRLDGKAERIRERAQSFSRDPPVGAPHKFGQRGRDGLGDTFGLEVKLVNI